MDIEDKPWYSAIKIHLVDPYAWIGQEHSIHIWHHSSGLVLGQVNNGSSSVCYMKQWWKCIDPQKCLLQNVDNGPLTRYVKLQVAHAPGMPGTFSPAADFKENRLLAILACISARAVMHVGIAYMRWQGKRSRHSRRMRTRNFTYLARGPCCSFLTESIKGQGKALQKNETRGILMSCKFAHTMHRSVMFY